MLVCLLALPMQTHAQSGDASWLNNLDGLDVAIGRSWMAPVVFETESTTTDYNDQGTAVSEVTTRNGPESTPMVSDAMQTQTLSALLYQFDTAENAERGLEMLNEAQTEQLRRDPRSPATNEVTPDLGDNAYGYEGVYEAEGPSSAWLEFAVVNLLVQDGPVVYQVFGQFLLGQHVEIATDVIADLIAADAGNAEPVYDMNGASTGGLWEKLNAVELAMPEGSTIYDLEIYPPADDAVMGDSVVVPEIDLDTLGDVPGISGSWHVAFGKDQSATPVATPSAAHSGPFSIELWVMEFEDPTYASAAAYSLNSVLTEPLGIVNIEAGGFISSDESGIIMVNTGFVRDSSLPEGDAAVVVQATGSTVYVARVYTNESAPTPIAKALVADLQTTPAGDDEESIDGISYSGGVWDRFPQPGSEQLHGLEPILVRHDDGTGEPAATPTS